MPYNKEDITRYLENELTALEKEQFEAEMKKDTALAAEVALYQDVAAALKQRLPEDAGISELRSSLKQISPEYFRPQKTKVLSFRKYVAAIAIAAAAVLFIVTLWPSASYTDKYGNIEMITSTERGENKDSLLQQASIYFNKKDYRQALPLLEAAVKADTASQMALFYRGVARQFTGAVVIGRKDLEKVFSGESVFQYEAAFYIGLGYAEEKNKSKAEEWLNKIPSSTETSEKATALLKKL